MERPPCRTPRFRRPLLDLDRLPRIDHPWQVQWLWCPGSIVRTSSIGWLCRNPFLMTRCQFRMDLKTTAKGVSPRRGRTLDTPNLPDFILLILSILSKLIHIQSDKIDRINRMKFICDSGSSIPFFHEQWSCRLSTSMAAQESKEEGLGFRTRDTEAYCSGHNRTSPRCGLVHPRRTSARIPRSVLDSRRGVPKCRRSGRAGGPMYARWGWSAR